MNALFQNAFLGLMDRFIIIIFFSFFFREYNDGGSLIEALVKLI